MKKPIGNEDRYVSRNGYRFFLSEQKWELSRGVVVNPNFNKYGLNVFLYARYLQVLAILAASLAPYTILTIEQAFRKLVSFSEARPFDCSLLLSFRQSESSIDDHIIFIKILFKKWLSLGYYGVEKDLLKMLGSWKLVPHIKGDAVKRLDPEQGPLSSIELQGLLECSAQKFEDGELKLYELALLLLFQASGRRPSQVAALKLVDLKLVSFGDQTKYYIDVPRLKQRGGGFRKEFRRFELIKETWEVLQAQRKDVERIVVAKFGCDVDKAIMDSMPLFIDESQLRGVNGLEELSECCAGDYLHMYRQKVSEAVSRAVTIADVISERTGELLRCRPRRFRYTLGYRAAREGYGVYVIAELLDHSDIQNVEVYTATVPEHAAHIESVVGKHLIPIANSFAGIIVTDRKRAKRGTAIQGDIRDLSGKSTGACGKNGTCGAGIPIPCYTCIHFQAWLDGPHAELYESLVNERARLLDVTKDVAVAGALDRTILAVSEVVSACQARKASLSKGR